MLVFAVELINYDKPTAVKQDISDLLNSLSLEAFQFWRTFEPFMTNNSSMPLKLKEHFKNLEFEIIQHTSWKKGSKVVSSI